jgi:hypothetical protein
MTRIRKTFIIVLAALAALYLLMVFILLNFPYHTLVSRVDGYLRSQYNTGFTAEEIAYRYPFTLRLKNVRVVHENSSSVLGVDNLSLKYRMLSFAKFKTFELSGNGISFQNQFAGVSEASVSLIVKLRLLRLMRGTEGNHISSVQFVAGGADVNRVLISGFEFSDIRLKGVQLFINSNGDDFSIERGVFSADILRADFSGDIGFDSVDITIQTSLTEEFYVKYQSLRSAVETVFRDGSLNMKLEGDIKNPRLRMLD